jgi:hypothetical protein
MLFYFYTIFYSILEPIAQQSHTHLRDEPNKTDFIFVMRILIAFLLKIVYYLTDIKKGVYMDNRIQNFTSLQSDQQNRFVDFSNKLTTEFSYAKVELICNQHFEISNDNHGLILEKLRQATPIKLKSNQIPVALVVGESNLLSLAHIISLHAQVVLLCDVDDVVISKVSDMIHCISQYETLIDFEQNTSLRKNEIIYIKGLLV